MRIRSKNLPVLKILDGQLAEITKTVPKAAVTKLQQVPLYSELLGKFWQDVADPSPAGDFDRR